MNRETMQPHRKDARNFAMLCDMAELTSLFERKSSVSDFLKDVVLMVAEHMSADVCSVYLFNSQRGELVLRATKGLDLAEGLEVSLVPGEGITGKAFEESRSIREGKASQNPYFKPIPGIEEGQYQAFLAVPIRRGVNKIGVLTLQDRRKNAFSSQDTRALKAIASQLAASLENAEVLMELYQAPEVKELGLTVVDGSGAGTGIAIGQAYILRTRTAAFAPLPTPHRHTDQGFDLTDELTRFAHALGHTKQQLETMQRTLDKKVAEVADLIFSAHLLMLKDEKFSGAMQEMIQSGSTAEEAVVSVVNRYVRLFNSKENPRVREKAQDVLDLGLRLVKNLANLGQVSGDYTGQIIVAADVFPSELVKLAAQNASGLVALGSGQTAHVALLARSLGLPALFVNSEQVLSIPSGTTLILDASHEQLHIDPERKVLREFEALIANRPKLEVLDCPVRSATSDGRSISVLANVNLIQDLESAQAFHADGVGLYRSEFPFLVRNDFPSEEEQTRLYRRVLGPMEGKEVVIRTLDVGGDKLVGAHQQYREANPFLGYRGIRFSLANPEFFSDQIRAILRAGEGRDLKIMFPMISSLDEYLDAREFVYRAIAELKKDGLPHHSNPQLGAMIELPAAVEIVAELAEIADFLSIGTNDLVMYTLAVDRTNEQIGSMYTPHHPAVLRVLDRIIAGVGAKLDKLSVCGESVNDPTLLAFLLGRGISKLSVDPNRIPRLKQRIQKTNQKNASKISQELLQLRSLRDMQGYISKHGLDT